MIKSKQPLWLSCLILALIVASVVYTRCNDGDTVGTTNIVDAGDTSRADFYTPGKHLTAADLQQVELPAGVPDEKVVYKGFTAHFNKQWHIPNCVTYEITAQEARGKRDREGDFEKDPRVAGCPDWWEYRGSGYDRGHMAPAGDMKWDKQAMTETFFMTNICPQRNELNAGLWNDLEIKVREWARRDKALIVISGPIVERGYETIGSRDKVAVPAAFFKVILAHQASPRRAIAFICPNRACNGALKSYVVSVDEVEERTGINFFKKLPRDEEARVEAASNFALWFNY